MGEKFERQPSSGESWNDAYEKRKGNIFQEFNPRLTDLNNRIITYLLEHGVDNSNELKNLEKEGDDLENQFDARVGQEDVSFRQQFDNQYRGLELGFDDFEQDRGFKQHDQHMKEVRRIMKQKPTIETLQQKAEELKKKLNRGNAFKKK